MTLRPASSTQDFQFIGGNLALDFVNTVGNRLGTPRDYFVSQAEFTRWARRAGLIGKKETIAFQGSAWRRILEIREELYQLFKPLAENKSLSSIAIERLNTRLAEVASKRQLLVTKREFTLIWRTEADDPDRILGPILYAAVDLLMAGSFRRIGECADQNCGWLFLDRSQRGKRKWCSMTDCGNRNKVHRYYQRKKRSAGH
jgi:predicted RNA-binding Zn ribbon-like protein